MPGDTWTAEIYGVKSYRPALKSSHWKKDVQPVSLRAEQTSQLLPERTRSCERGSLLKKVTNHTTTWYFSWLASLAKNQTWLGCVNTMKPTCVQSFATLFLYSQNYYSKLYSHYVAKSPACGVKSVASVCFCQNSFWQLFSAFEWVPSWFWTNTAIFSSKGWFGPWWRQLSFPRGNHPDGFVRTNEKTYILPSRSMNNC